MPFCFRGSCTPDQLAAPVLAGRGFPRIHNFAGDDGGHWAAFEHAGVEGRVAGFAGGFGSAEGPRAVERKNGEVSGLPGSDGAFETENARRTGGEQLDDTKKRNAAGVYELLERERQCSLESGDAE